MDWIYILWSVVCQEVFQSAIRDTVHIEGISEGFMDQNQTTAESWSRNEYWLGMVVSALTLFTGKDWLTDTS